MSVESQIKTALAEIQRGTQEIIGLEYIEKLIRDYFENEIRAMGTLPLIIRMAEDFNRSVDSFEDMAHQFN